VNIHDPAFVTAIHAFEPEGGRESELDVMRRLHRQNVAAERARIRELRRAQRRHGAHGIARPAFALWALVDPRR
jgi:hypothetical protein